MVGSSLATVFAQPAQPAPPALPRHDPDILRFQPRVLHRPHLGRRKAARSATTSPRSASAGASGTITCCPWRGDLSTPDAEILAFPAASFVRFFRNHRLVNREQPWADVSREPRQPGIRQPPARAAEGAGKLRSRPSRRPVDRQLDGVVVRTAERDGGALDEVVFGTHADQTLQHRCSPNRAREGRAVLSAVEITAEPGRPAPGRQPDAAPAVRLVELELSPRRKATSRDRRCP